MSNAQHFSPWHHRLIAGLVLVAGVSLSLAVCRSARDEAEQREHARFDTAAARLQAQVERRMGGYVEVLAGLRALFHTSEVSREDFRRFTVALNLKREFPGFQVLNYAPHVPAGSEDAFEAALRSSHDVPHRERLGISPPGAREGYHPLALIEPLAGNEQYLGKDIAVAPPVRAALDKARDSGKLSSSGKLIQDRGGKGQVGLAMRMPVYRPGLPIDTVEQRRAAYVGSVGAGFLVHEMFAGLPGLDEGLRLALYDGGPETNAASAELAVQADKMVFDSAPSRAVAQSAPVAMRRVQSFTLGGRQWVLEVSQPQSAEGASWERMFPTIIAAGGVVISVLIASVLLSLMGSQRRAIGLAREMTRNLRASEQRLAEAQGLAKVGSWVLDDGTGRIECSDEARRIYGFEPDTATLQRMLALVPRAQRVRVTEAITAARLSDAPVELEHALHASDGCDRWVRVNLQRALVEGAARVCATVRDETARQKSALRLELAHDIARMLAAEDDPQAAVSHVLASIGSRLAWDAAVCWLRHDDGQVTCVSAWAPDSEPTTQAFTAAMRRWSFDAQAQDAACNAVDTLWRDIAPADPASPRDAVAGRCGLQSALAVPVDAGVQHATLEFFSRAPTGVDPDIEGFMRSIASQLAQYLQRKQAEHALRHLASHDALTGLASRTLLHERLSHALQRAVRNGTRVAVLFMDLDRFKHINDSLGHSAGDVLLRECARRVRECVRECDTVARFGGDEFVVVLEDLADPADAVMPLSKMLECIGTPFEVNGRELTVTGSIGVSTYPEDGLDVETLLMNADAAMYRAKDKGAGTYEFYAEPLNAQGSQRLVLESGLRRALEREELFLVYQPKLDLGEARVTGVEALLRWRHPTLGIVSPAQFIPIAEDTGLIEPIGQWALEKACRDARRWQDNGHRVTVAVNLAARQLDRPRLAKEVARALERAQLEPQWLELEVTESGVMRNPTRAAAQLRELRALGIGLAIDDFGTGYSSLSYLQRFPFSTLKIDRSFIKDLPEDADASALTAGIIGLAQRLRMTVVAEGVETLEQLALLRANRCDVIQGYYLSKPLGERELDDFLARDVRNLLSPMAAA